MAKASPERLRKRYRFAMILDDALNLKMQQVEVLAGEKKAKEDAEK